MTLLDRSDETVVELGRLSEDDLLVAGDTS